MNSMRKMMHRTSYFRKLNAHPLTHTQHYLKIHTYRSGWPSLRPTSTGTIPAETKTVSLLDTAMDWHRILETDGDLEVS